MGRDVYERLAKHLDNLPSGFPRTDSGAEMRILRKLFTPEHAELALHLTLIPEEPRVIARRARTTVEEAGRRLEEMEKKCLARAIRPKGDSVLYMAQPFVVGFWEGQVNTLNLDLVKDFEEYLPSWFDPKSWRKAAQLRTIPVNKSISVRNEVMLYDSPYRSRCSSMKVILSLHGYGLLYHPCGRGGSALSAHPCLRLLP